MNVISSRCEKGKHEECVGCTCSCHPKATEYICPSVDVPAVSVESDRPVVEHSLDQSTGIPRRCRLDLLTPAEMAILDAIDAVEALPAHTLLTEAVVLLGSAKDKVADFVDSH